MARKKDKKNQRKFTNDSEWGFRDTARSTVWCDHPPKEIFQHKKVRVFGARKNDVEVTELPEGKTLILNCSQDPIVHASPFAQLPEKWKALNTITSVAEEIVLDWRDYGTPPVPPEFWGKLLAMSGQKKVRNLIVCCMGGHGRAGTALAALVLASGYIKNGEESINFVRFAQCDECIETPGQEAYVLRCALHYGHA